MPQVALLMSLFKLAFLQYGHRKVQSCPIRSTETFFRLSFLFSILEMFYLPKHVFFGIGNCGLCVCAFKQILKPKTRIVLSALNKNGLQGSQYVSSSAAI